MAKCPPRIAMRESSMLPPTSKRTRLTAATIPGRSAPTAVTATCIGLMGVKKLAAEHGMLFVWKDVAPREFYMKDTLIPLDLISIRGRAVVGVATMTPCKADPCPITTTPPADSALEVPAGTAERAGISAGAPVESSVF
ncbi:MAG: DUF192 domain-containing protein [Actinobacteria bacterium]|nr:MAG: DUF192 domain-containing protein [Actinomycetota bacterium]